MVSMYIKLYVIALIVLAVIDAVWLFSTSTFYKKAFGGLFLDQFNFSPAILFYLLYTLGIVFFVLLPVVKSGGTIKEVLLVGALFGLVAYATYDLTNYATLKGWPSIVTWIDLAWGMVLTSSVSAITFTIFNSLK